MGSENEIQQIELVYRLLSSQEERAKFLNDPEAYIKDLGYEVDESFSVSLSKTLNDLEQEYAKIGAANPYIKKKHLLEQTQPIMNAVAVASVVSAAAAVVSAAAAVTSATSAAKAAKD